MAEDSPFDLARAPFSVREGAQPQEVAREIVACFVVVSGLRDRTTRSFRAAMGAARIARDDALFRAGEAMARDIDAGIGAGAGNAYHNSKHYCEVVLSALHLSLLGALAKGEQARLLVAALAHDFHHDGKIIHGIPFRLERVAVEATIPYLEAAAVPEDERARIAALILATQVSTAVTFVRQCYRHFFGDDEQPRAPESEPRLALLAVDARLALQAVLLTEADVLPSVGLTEAHGELSQLNLSRERGKELGPTDKLHFLGHVFGDFLVSRFFSPNVERLKQAMLGKSGNP
jgi:hypothetical protein